MTERRVIRRLNRLYRICEAGERGFVTVATNVNNRGLKVLLKTYAQQRAQFAAEIRKEIQRLGGKIVERPSIPGIIHRGRINIVATLILEHFDVEKMVLRDAALAERVALRIYKYVLEKELPAETKAILEPQYEQIQIIRNEIARLRGRGDHHLVVRLFDSDEDLQTAIQALQGDGFSADKIETVPIKEIMNVYQGQGSTIGDTVISGAFGGALWGSLLGAVAGVGVFLFPNLYPFSTTGSLGPAGFTILAGLIIGAFFGVVLGFLIGVGVAEEDTSLYEDSIQYGDTLVKLQTDNQHALEASRIMHQVNTATRKIRETSLTEPK